MNRLNFINNPKILLSLAFCLATLCFYPGLNGFFIFDDYGSITHNPTLKLNFFNLDNLIEIASSGTSGPFKRPISILSFASNIFFTGLEPLPFKLTNLVIHLCNGLLIYLISKTLITVINPKINSYFFALLTCTFFLIHPITLSSVLYIVQRMTSLSTLFSLLGILFYIKGRLSPPTNKSYTLIFLSLFICTPLTVLSKENGLLLPYFLLLIEFVFFRFNSPNKKLSVTLRYGSMLLIAIPVLIASYNYSHIINWVVGGYSTRDFTLTERLLTESRVVCFYLRLIFLPNINLMGIFHDDIALSSSLFSPANTLFSCLFILGLLISAIALIRKAPIFSFGILFFFLGHSIESSFLSLEITHEHRNYLPLFGLVFMFCYYLTILLETIPKNYKYIIISTLIIFLSGNTVLRASQWGNQLLLSLTEVKNHPNSYRANHELSRVYQILANHKTTNSHQYEKQSLTYATKAYKLKPNKPGALLNLIHHSYLSHQPVSNDLYIQLYKLLKNRAITNKVTYTVSSFVDCTISKKCHPSSEQINTLLNTVLNASLINKDNKAKTIINLAKLAATENNHRLSIAYLIRATEISNRFETHYLLTTTLIDFKFFDKALKQIMFMKTQNYNSANFKRLTILKQKLKLTHTNK